MSGRRTALLVTSIGLLLVAAALIARYRSPSTPSARANVLSATVLTSPAAVARAAQTPPNPSGSASIDVCGHGQLPVPPPPDRFADPNPDRVMTVSLIKPVEASWIASLQNNGDPRVRAVGLMLNEHVPGTPFRPEPDLRAHSELVQMAVAARDPAVYALALAGCRAVGKNAAGCNLLTVRHWTELEPDNLTPWLMLAEQAHWNRDAAGEADAFEHAAHATHEETWIDQLATFTAPALPPDLGEFERYEVLADLVKEGQHAAPNYQILLHHCTGDFLNDVATRATCSSIASMLVNVSHDLMGRSVGIRIGSHVEWPPDRIEKLLEEQRALMTVPIALGYEGTDCVSIRKYAGILAAQLAGGELGAARAALRRPDRYPEEDVQRIIDSANESMHFMELDIPGLGGVWLDDDGKPVSFEAAQLQMQQAETTPLQ
jgi:hypothetical protein